MQAIMILVGRVEVKFTKRSDERLYPANGKWHAEIVVPHVATAMVIKIGSYDTIEQAAKALYIERDDFSAAYGA